MSASTTEQTPQTKPGGGDTDSLIHTVCPRCHPDVTGVVPGRVTALCGRSDTFGQLVTPDPARACVVCQDLRPRGCPKCGLR